MATKLLYLYTQPFVVDARDPEEYILDYLSEEDRKDEQKVHALLMKFAVEEKLIEVVGNQFSSSRGEDTGNWGWDINWMNFRSLVDKTRYAKLMNALQANQGYGVTQIIDLYTRLGILFEEKLLNTLVNRTIQSISLLPYDVPPKVETVEWRTIHKETPFVWLCILMQTVICCEAKLIKA